MCRQIEGGVCVCTHIEGGVYITSGPNVASVFSGDLFFI